MKKYVSLVSLVLFAGFLLSACGSGQLFGPTLTPTPTPTLTPVPPTLTPTPPPGLAQPGEWSGEGRWGFAKVKLSFTVSNDGNTINNFALDITDESMGLDCHGNFDEVTINPDGSFIIIIGTNESEGKVSELTGTFETKTQLVGTGSQILVCGDLVMEWIGDPPYGSWNASPTK